MSKQLEQMNEQRTDKVNRLKVAEKDRDNLSGSKAEAESFINTEKEIRRKKNVLYQVYEKLAQDSVTELTGRQRNLESKLAEEQSKINANDALLSQKELSYNATNSLYDKVAKEVDAATKEFGAFERRDVKIQEDMKFMKTQLKKHQANIEKEVAKETSCLQDAESIKHVKESLQKELSEVEEKKAAEEKLVEEIMSGLQEATAGLRVQLETEQEHLAGAERDVAQFQTEKESIVTAITLVKNRSANVADSLSKLNEKHGKILSERTENEAKIGLLTSEMNSLDKMTAEHEHTLKCSVAEELHLQSAIRSAIAATEEGRAALASTDRSTGVLGAIMKAVKRDGPLATAGVLGRLGDLGTIPPAYDIAVSTACSSLDYIVTRSTDGAQACMEYLRAHNLGRASFIALDKMSEWGSRMSRVQDLPAPRLFDLIKPTDDSVLPAFYFALKDTLVASDLDAATKIAYDGDRAKWRVVTMQGGLIDTSGAMSGGGNSARKGLMLLEGTQKAASAAKSHSELPSVTVADIQQLESRVADLQKQLKICRSSKDATEAGIRDNLKKSKSLNTDIVKLQMALKNSVDKEQQVSQRVATLQSEIHLTQVEVQEISVLEKKLGDIDARIFSVSPNISTFRSAVSRLQRKIMDVGGPKVTQAQQKLEILTRRYDDIANKLASAEVTESTAHSNAVKAASAREKVEVELSKCKSKLDELREEQQVMEKEALLVIEAVEKAKACMLKQEEELKSITAEYSMLKDLSAQLKVTEIDLKNDLNGLSKKLDAQEAVRKSWQTKLAEIRAKHIEDQEQFNAAVASCVGEHIEPFAADTAASEPANGELEVLPVLSDDALGARRTNCDEMLHEIAELEQQKTDLEKNVNMSALLEYLKKDAIFRARSEEVRVITEARNTVRREYEDLRRQRLTMFMSGFSVITLKLKEMYQLITLGGDAELELVDSMDPFSEGIVFSVRPPKKSWKNISNLSGGEKTLSSLALVFALHHFKPTALYVMDEIDAALDFKNVSIVANYIKERTKNAQFVIISLRNNMFELADRLVGIYKTNDATKSVTINPRAFADATNGKLASKGSRLPLSDATNNASS